MKTALRTLLASLVLVMTVWPAGPAQAAERSTRLVVPTTTVSPARYPDTAYDPATNVFLAVTGSNRAQAAWLSPSGVQIGATFNVTASTAYQQAPRANCGESGVCLIVWHEGSKGTVPMGRMISYAGGFLTAPFPLGIIGSSWEMGMGIAYSPVSHEFLVTWMGDFNRTTKPNDIFFARVNLAGQVLATVNLADTASYEREPNVGYNPASDEFVLTYAGIYLVNGAEVAYLAAQRIKNGAVVGAPMILDQAGGMRISAVEYNPATQSVVVAWHRSPNKIYARSISAAGVPGSTVVISATQGAYDAVDFNYNPVSESFLFVTHGSTGIENVGIEVKGDLTPSPAFTLTATPRNAQTGKVESGNFNPRIATSTAAPVWMVATAMSFRNLVAQFATGTPGFGHCVACGGGGGGGGTGGTPNPAMSLDTPAANQTVAATFTVSGWAIDRGAAAGTGVGSVRVWASANSGAGTPVLLGTAAYGGVRSDVGNQYGAQFANSGFSFTATLQPGTYQVRAEALSTVSGTYNQSAAAIVRVSQAVVTLDSPAASATVANNFSVSGWAVDPGSASGTGVDIVALYAYPNPGSGAPPLLLAVAPYGYARPDVAAAMGSSRFTASGFNATIGNLVPATYQLVAFGHATASNTWFPVSRTITVGRGKVITIDTPSNFQTVGSGFAIAGWTANLASLSGTGVNLVQVWAYPSTGAPAIFLGTATYGVSRTDVAALWGTQFRNSGYTLTTAPLARGTYTVVVFARNSATGVFDNAKTLGITIP